MKALYEMLGIRKQAHYGSLERKRRKAQLVDELIREVIAIRKRHPRLGARKIYHMLQPIGIGRDGFEQAVFASGLKLKSKRNYRRTTRAHRWKKYENLISGRQVKKPYELLVSDITYIQVGRSKYYYLFLIQDVYTRGIVGWQLSTNMLAENLVAALRMVIKRIPTERRKGMIFHSDRGSQYLSGELHKMQELHGIRTSMGNKAWENAHAESLNGIIKNEYIKFQAEPDYKKMKKQVGRSIELYNEERPHGSLRMQTPREFETNFGQLAVQNRPIVNINY